MPVNGLKTLPKRCPHLPSVDLPSLDLSAEPVAIVPLALRYDFFSLLNPKRFIKNRHLDLVSELSLSFPSHALTLSGLLSHLPRVLPSHGPPFSMMLLRGPGGKALTLRALQAATGMLLCHRRFGWPLESRRAGVKSNLD